MRLWRPYLAIMSARFRTLLQYRGAALGGIGSPAWSPAAAWMACCCGSHGRRRSVA
jgi:hypothetical protein